MLFHGALPWSIKSFRRKCLLVGEISSSCEPVGERKAKLLEFFLWGLRHLRTRPYTPRTNGKAERFIQTALREWAYACLYQNSDHRRAQLDPWLHQYNWRRPHASVDQSPPI